ncbi:putative nonribosomal peptide synthetase [Sparassis latifolia]
MSAAVSTSLPADTLSFERRGPDDQHFDELGDLARVVSFSGVLDLPQVLHQFHADAQRGIHTDFEAIARTHPDRIAVELGVTDVKLTFRELDQLANHVADQLLLAGIEREELVPVIASRTPQAIAGIIGIVKAGGAYVPCDAEEWTQDRIDTVFATIKPRVVVVSDPGFATLVPAHMSKNVIYTEASKAIAPSSCQVVPSSNRLAYVIMTSGTSGAPKGVMVDHKNLIQYAHRSEHDKPGNMGVQPGDRCFLVFSVAFDAFSGALWSCLCNGATLCLADKSSIASVAKHASHVPLTPSLLSSLSPGEYPRIRGIFAGGEALPLSLVQSWAREGLRIFNCYGPTETTCAATMIEIHADSQQVTIGRPLVGYAVLVVDENMKPVGVGVSGEMVIGGRGVARGYYANKKLTDEKFVELEWVEKTLGIKGTGKWYRTGDLARWTADGTLEYLGRSDWRVKNRGFLIDLEGDVESAMLNDDTVSDAKAFMIRGRLIGAVTPANVDAKALRERLLMHTPAYMVCNKIFALDTFPRTSNDKTDRRGVQALIEQLLEEDSTSYGPAPANEAQRAVAKGFRALFRLHSEVGVHASFIELGGDSLGAIRLVSLVRASGFSITFLDVIGLNIIEAIAAAATPLSSAPSVSKEQATTDEDEALLREVLGPDADVLAEDIAPLTPVQRGMFMTTATKPTVYSIQTRSSLQDLDGPFDRARFVHAWRLAAQRHAIFRSSFHLEHGSSGVQIVHRRIPELNYSLREFESDADLEAALGAYVEEDLKTGFSVDDFVLPGKLMRLALFVSSQSNTASFVWTVHHGLIDGLSATVLHDELIQDYNDSQRPLSPARSFASVARSIVRKQSDLEEKVTSFWKESLKGAEPVAPINLPCLLTSAPVAHEIVYESSLALDLVAEFARQSSVTMTTVFIAAAAVVLCRYTNKRDTNIGIVLTGRSTMFDAERVVGPVVNTLPIHVNLEDDSLSVRDFVKATSKQVMSLTSWEWASLRSAMTALDIPADKNLFDFGFSFSDDFASEVTPSSGATGLQMLNSVTTEQTEFPFTITFERSAKQTAIVRFRQQPQRIHETYAQNMGRHFCNAVTSFMSASLVKGVQLTDATERQFLTHGLNSHHTEVQRQTVTILDRLEQSMTAHKDLDAIAQGTASMSYAELDRQSSAVAYYLASHHGVTVGSTVGILAMHNFEWLIGVCGILKAGGTYLPIDAKYPLERQTWILEQRDNVGILLVPQATERYRAMFKVKLLRVAELVEAKTPPVSLARPTTQDVVVYIYTSGTTGVPKGVPMLHGGLDTTFMSDYGHLWAAPGRRVGLMMALGFDGHLMCIFGPLLYGGTVVLQDPDDPLEQLKHVHCVMCTPSTLASLDEAEHKNIEYVVVGGESVPQGLADTWSVGRTVGNMYGPTECHIAVTFKYLTPGEPVALGRPFLHTRIYCVDPDTCLPVPVGLPGEMWIGGSSPTSGYVGRPDSTNEKFIADSFGYPGERIYRTGDIGRWNLKGELEYVGRMDDLIKLKGGFRLSLVGVENALIREASNFMGTPLATATVVLVNDRLVAYVTPGSINTGSLRERLMETEPHFAVPKWIIALDNPPMTANQKIDRKALMARPLPQDESRDFQPPKTETEQHLAEIWKDMLDTSEDVSAMAHFLRLGGTSLNQIRLVSALQRLYKIKIPLTLVIIHPVLRDLARAVDDLLATTQTVTYSAVEVTDIGVLSHSERGMWLGYQLATVKTPFTVSALYTIKGAVDVDLLKQAFDLVIARHVVFGARYTVDEKGEPRRETSGPSPQALIVSPQDFNDTLHTNLNYVFDISAGPLVRVRLSSKDSTTSVLFAANHIVVDHWSIDLVMKDISNVYTSMIRGTYVTPSPRELDYPIWAASASRKHEPEMLAFWGSYLRGIPDCIALPLSRPRPAMKSYAGRSRFFDLPEELRQIVERAAIAVGVTLHQFFSAALILVLSVFAHQDDIVVGASHANRRTAEEYELCGLFLDRVPFRHQLHDGNRTSTEKLLRSVVDSQRAASLHFSVPFDEIVRHVGTPRNLGRHPLFQVMLSVENENETIPKLRIPGAEVESVMVAPEGSNFDLLLGYQLLPKRQGMRLRFEASDIYDDSLVNALETAMRTSLAMLAGSSSTPLQICAALDAYVVRAPSCEDKMAVVRCTMLTVIDATPSGVRQTSPGSDVTFFELGGTSLMVPMLLKELELRRVRISFIEFFLDPSISGVASRASFELR